MSMEDPSAPKWVDELIARAQAARASDVHFQTTAQGAEVTLRLDGVMTPLETIPAPLAERVFGRIKYLARLKTYQESLPQDGRIEKQDVHADHDIRVSTYPTVTGEKIVLRLFTTQQAQTLGQMGLPDPARVALEQVLRQNAGMVLLTGPAGSGKTTTIYGCLHYLAGLGGRHIITVEDPVEQVLPGVMQTEINEDRGLTFPKAARHLLRQDPQVLVIGEIRDEETARIAVRAASTGHLLISTLHAGSCRGVVDRLVMLSGDPWTALASLELIVNQRLARKLCRCAGAGCEQCLGTGYRGRVPIVEFVRLTSTEREKLQRDDRTAITPALTLEDSARELVNQGITTQAEIDRVLGRPTGDAVRPSS